MSPPTKLMVFRKRYNRRTAAARLQRWARKKKGKYAQSGQIQYVSKRVTRLQRRVRNNSKFVKQDLALAGNIRIGSIVAGTSCQVLPIMPALSASATYPTTLPSWTTWCGGVGNEDPNIAQCASVRYGRLNGELTFAASTEPTPISISVHLVSLQKSVASQIWQSRLPDLSLDITTDKYMIYTATQTFPTISTAGFTKLCGGVFKTHWSRQFFIGSSVYDSLATPVTRMSDSVKRFKFSIPLSYVVNNGGRSTWTTLAPEYAIPDQYARYLIITSDNNLLDLQSPTMSYLFTTTAHGKL